MESGRRQRAAEAEQLWDTLKLGTPLCYLFNLLPDQPDISGPDTTPSAIDVDDVEAHKAATQQFLGALKRMGDRGEWVGGHFELAEMYDDKGGSDSSKIIKVRTNIMWSL